MKVIKLVWRDSNRYLDQSPLDDDYHVVTIQTVGFLIKEKDDCFIVSQDIIDDELRGVIVIPKENISEYSVV